jgi:hypothetical protein
MTAWPVETIPDADSLFYRVSLGWLRPGNLTYHPGIFRENKGSISADWEKYSTASETRARPGRPERFAVIRMIAGQVRGIVGLTVIHSPTRNVPGLPDNRAHTCIYGLESHTSPQELGRKERIRTELHKLFNTWEIAPNAPVD